MYSEDDIQHLCYWLCNGSKQHNSSIAASFSKALTFSYSHLARKCHHEFVPEGLVNSCRYLKGLEIVVMCHVCALPQVSPIDRLHELSLMVNAIDRHQRRKKLAQYIHGSSEVWIKKLPNLSSNVAYGKSLSNLSLEWWRQFAKQCSVAGYFVRKVGCGTFPG